MGEKSEVEVNSSVEEQETEKKLERIKLKFNLDDVNKFFGSRGDEFERITGGRFDIFERQPILAQKGKKNWNFSELPAGFFGSLLGNGKKCGRSFNGELGNENADGTASWQSCGRTSEVLGNHFEALKAMVDFYNNNFETLRNTGSNDAAILMRSLRKVVNIANELYGHTDKFFQFLAEESKDPSERSRDFALDDYAQNILGLQPGVDYSLSAPVAPDETDKIAEPAEANE